MPERIRKKKKRRRSHGSQWVVLATLLVGGSALLGVQRLTAARTELVSARRELKTASQAVAHRDNRRGDEALNSATARLRAARRHGSSFPLNLLSPVPVLGSPGRATRAAARAGREAVAAGRTLLAASGSFPTSSSAGLQGRDLAPFHDAAVRSSDALAKARTHVAAAEAALAGPSGAALPPVSRQARAMQAEIRRSGDQLERAGRALDLLAELSSAGAEARILVLSQDSLELRPTGGYIGSFGVLRFSKGTVGLERYAASEELPPPNPPLDAPPELAPALPGEFRMSNSNWWPHFPKSAEMAREMFRRHGGGEIDGVLAITEHATSRLLGAVGPLQVPGYAKPVAEEGFDERVLFEVELKRPLDNPRKKFLTELATVLFDRIFHLPADQLPRLGAAIDRSVASRDIQLWFADPARQNRIAGTVVAGELPHVDGDFLMLVDANLTASKANIGLVKDVTYRVRRQGDLLLGRLQVRVHNQPEQSFLNPVYNAFLRVYVPKGSVLVHKREDQGEQGVASDGPYQVFAQPIELEPEGRLTLTFDYLLPPEVASQRPYRLTWLRQPGTPRDSLTAVLENTRGSVGIRELHFQRDDRGNAVMEWLRRRWLVDKLGL